MSRRRLYASSPRTRGPITPGVRCEGRHLPHCPKQKPRRRDERCRARARGPRVRGDDIFRVLFGLLGLVVALSAGVSSAQAHPHVWITATSELIYAPDGSITGVRHAWTFDDMFSTYALQGIETKTKGVYSREELGPLAQTNVESLKEYGFFTFARVDGQKQPFLAPADYFLDYRDSTLVLHFTLPFKTPIKTKQLVVEIFDPTYFVDFAPVSYTHLTLPTKRIV